MKKLLLALAGLAILLVAAQSLHLLPFSAPESPTTKEHTTLVYEESVITQVVDSALPSVVTVGINKEITQAGTIKINPLNPLAPIQRTPATKQTIEKNIGSGFIVSSDGLVITNGHVVADAQASYKILTTDKKEYKVQKIYRDPLNDLSILKIDANGLTALPLGDSSILKLGQLAIAIGTPLGEFPNTVTSGIISGLGRGITAGSPFAGYVEKLDNVIQTDAAISGGNSGGPLLNSKGQVIGINTAVSQQGQNIGFAIPVNVIKNLLEDFAKRGGSFERPYLGVRYKVLDRQTALLNKVVEGAYVLEVLPNSPAQKAGIVGEDIIVEFDGKKISGDDSQSLAKILLDKKVGDRVVVQIWRAGQIQTLSLTLEPSQ